MKTFLLIGASIRSLLRWARQHVYAWLILAPVVLGITYVTLIRLAENLPDWDLSPRLAVVLAALFNFSLFGLSLSRASSELYHARRPESYFDALPVSAVSYLHYALAMRAARTAVVAIAFVLACAAFGQAQLARASDLPPLVGFVAVAALSELLAALTWIHWGHKKDAGAAGAALFVLLLSGVLGGLLLTAAIQRPSVFARFEFQLLAICAGWALVVYSIVRRLNELWRGSDIEYARRLQSSAGLSIPMARGLERRLSPSVAAQLTRDLRLTLRAFSSAVYVVFAVAMLWTAALTAALTTELLPTLVYGSGWLDATWLPQVMAIKAVCVLTVVTISSVLPVLIAFELPHMWLERAAGTTGLELLQAKILYARILTAPAPLIVWCAGMLVGEVPGYYALPLLGECLWLWWLVSSLIGVFSFEMPMRPELAIIVIGTLASAAGVVGVIFWPAGLVIYPQAMHSLTARGRQRARYYMITEAE